MNKPAIAAPCTRVGLGTAVGAHAQGTAEPASRAGPHVLLAAGRSHYNHDRFLFACDDTRGNATMLGLG